MPRYCKYCGVDAPNSGQCGDVVGTRHEFIEAVAAALPSDVIQRLAYVELEINDSHHVLPPRFLDPVKRSSVLILHPDDEPSGVGFFVSPCLIVTANHNLKRDLDSSSTVRVKLFDDRGQFVSSTLNIKRRYPDYDLAVLTSSTAHEPFLKIAVQSGENSFVVGENRLAVTSFGIALTTELADIQFSGDGFAVIPAQMYRKSTNHIVYMSNLFSGDSGGAVVFSRTGDVVALHLETVNQANEELEHGKYTMEDVANSVNSVVKGFSQGFLGLRLDSCAIQNMIFH